MEATATTDADPIGTNRESPEILLTARDQAVIRRLLDGTAPNHALVCIENQRERAECRAKLERLGLLKREAE